ncbi:MAG: crotonase/enoyl-CoA hydratase family protein [Pseudomonadales bacterium]|nr:crotonase/enoyl-CoA hydratase family protein [Pseudomonadales bacterium]MCP5185897.1 crotonase/enoyl-CoA hydratase family protein [Pseudomonadales bacterium]
MTFQHILYERQGRIATLTLNRPERLNAICPGMPREIAAAVALANDDPDVHVLVVTGTGRAFCAGYDLVLHAENQTQGAAGPAMDADGRPWDPMADFHLMQGNTQHFMSLWRCHKPTIAKIHGYAVAGGSDIALCCDLVVMADDARIGYPPARVWGCPTTAWWVYRVGAERAKRMLFTGDLISGREAAAMGLVLESVPSARLDQRVQQLAERIQGVPRNQLMMQKLMVNQALENMGLTSTQTLATLFDGIARHSPEGVWFKKKAESEGFKEAIRARDSGESIAPGVSRIPRRFE